MCFRVRQIPVATDIHSLAQAILERFLDEGHITIDKERSTLVECCYNPKTAKTAIIHFRPKPPHSLSKLRSNETYEFEISPGCDVFIDKHFYGLTQLYTPLADIKLEVSIIAISGLNGHAYGSWAGYANSENRKKMWLRHFFQSDRPDCRTLIYGYNSSLSEPGMHTLSDYSVGFLEEIDKARKGCEQDRPVALVGHSFGGIIIAKALVEDRESPQRKGNLFKMTKAIVFFATPHRGMLFDDIREMVGDGSPRLDLVDAIGRGQEAVDLLSFTRYTEEEHFRVVSFHELLQTKRLEMDPETGVWARTGPYYTPVERKCSILNLPSNIEEVLGGEGDHSSLVKFQHPQDHTYTTILTRFSNLIDHLGMSSNKTLHSPVW
ncbi:hypothetical protein DFP73DRAFT_484041 [Morchella snyderi]|nr:hypothetical protein DFP73DRAFT_484041 [Morchella snyderi]